MIKKTLNVLWFITILILLYAIFKLNPSYYSIFSWFININFLTYQKSINGWTIMNLWFVLYAIIYVVYYMFFSNWYGKPYYFWKWIFNLVFYQKIEEIEKFSILNICVKLVFLPLMFYWCFSNFVNLLNTISNIIYYLPIFEWIVKFYWRHLHWFFYNLIFFVDVLVFLIWYSIESPKLKNIIKSVEPSALWWLVALACYPLLNTFTTKFLWWFSSDFPDFVKYFWESQVYFNLSMFWWMLFIVLMWIYVWASVALWFKASNLTNRWIVFSWPYKYLRHPAYVCKNLARLIWALPLFTLYFKNSDYNKLFWITVSLLGWILIYHFRALTEENHLSQDKDYLDYKSKVKNMYLPDFK